MTLGGQYETLAGLPPSEKDYRQLVSDETMLACKLISPGQTLALRRSWAIPVARELVPILEGDAADNDEQDEEDEVTLVRRKRVLEVAQGLNADQI